MKMKKYVSKFKKKRSIRESKVDITSDLYFNSVEETKAINRFMFPIGVADHVCIETVIGSVNKGSINVKFVFTHGLRGEIVQDGGRPIIIIHSGSKSYHCEYIGPYVNLAEMIYFGLKEFVFEILGIKR